MRVLFKALILFFSIVLSFSPQVWGAEQNSPLVVFQVIQAELVFDHSTVESATLVPLSASANNYGVNVKLNKAATAKIEELTQANIGKRADVMFNKKLITAVIIQSKLGGEFLVAGFTKEEGEQFIKSLTLTK